jgi:hypothetical protein
MQDQQIRLDGRFTVKDGLGDRVFLAYEAGPGPMVTIELESGISRPEADKIAKAINRGAEKLVIDFSYSPAAKLGFAAMLVRLQTVLKNLQGAMTELIDKKDYSEAERLLRIVDKLMVELLKDAGGNIASSR